MGRQAHAPTKRIYRNQSKILKLKPFKDCVRTQHKICPQYIKWQCTPYREYGADLETFIADDDLLNI